MAAQTSSELSQQCGQRTREATSSPALRHDLNMPFRKKKDEPDITDEFGGMDSEEESSEGSGEEASDDDAPIYKVADEDGQVALEPPVKYQARRKAKIRIMSAMDSDEVGELNPDAWITVTHTKEVDGVVRLRFIRGWVGHKTTKGYNLFISEAEEDGGAQFMKLVKKEADIRKEADPASEVVGKLAKNDIFEVLEVASPADKYKGKHSYKKQQYVRMHQGWVSTHRCEDKLMAKEVVGVQEKTLLQEEYISDPAREAARAKKAEEDAKQAKIDAKKNQKLAKGKAAETKKEIAALEQFQTNLSALLAAMPECCEEDCKAKLEACGAAAAEQKKKLAKAISGKAEEGVPPEAAK